jgi:hypothetical protein
MTRGDRTTYIADADREAAAAFARALRAGADPGEFNHRLDAVFAATTQRGSGSPAIFRVPPRLGTAAGYRYRWWPGAGRREHQSGWRARPGAIPVIIAVLTAWLLVSDCTCGCSRGRAGGHLLAIFAAVRLADAPHLALRPGRRVHGLRAVPERAVARGLLRAGSLRGTTR